MLQNELSGRFAYATGDRPYDRGYEPHRREGEGYGSEVKMVANCSSAVGAEIDRCKFRLVPRPGGLYSVISVWMESQGRPAYLGKTGAWSGGGFRELEDSGAGDWWARQSLRFLLRKGTNVYSINAGGYGNYHYFGTYGHDWDLFRTGNYRDPHRNDPDETYHWILHDL